MGPLDGVQVVEIASLAPAPFGCMVLADLGADVLRVDRADTGGPDPGRAQGPLSRGRRSVQLNLGPRGHLLLLAPLEDADARRGFRPGVAERLGFGPEECARRNPRLIYARMTGGGGRPPTAGHDIDYIAISGVLHPLGRAGERASVNLLGDFGGGGMLMALGILAALVERERSGLGRWWTYGGWPALRPRSCTGCGPAAPAGERARTCWTPEPRSTTPPNQGRQVRGRGRAGGKVRRGAAGRLGSTSTDGEPPLPHQLDESGWSVLRGSSPPRSPAGPGTSGSSARTRTPVPVPSPARRPAIRTTRPRGTFTEVAGLVSQPCAAVAQRTPAGSPGAAAAAGADTAAVLAGSATRPGDRRPRSRGVVGGCYRRLNRAR